MKQTIARITSQIFIDFQKSIRDNNGLCPVKGLRYDGMRIPDYNDIMVQQLYLLRYFPAYLVEYYDIYREILKYKALKKPFRVLSIGCGCGLDYYALELALRDQGTNCSKSVYYTGVDKIKWHYTDSFGNRDYKIITTNILDLGNINQIQEEPFDIIIFPKSIGEFSDNEFELLIGRFNASDFPQKKVFIVSSLRKEYSAIDQERMRILLENIERTHGYICNKPKTEYIYYTQSVGLRKYFPDFIYPNDIYQFLDNLSQACPTRKANGRFCEDDCADTLSNKRPILRTDHIRYQYFMLTKEI